MPPALSKRCNLQPEKASKRLAIRFFIRSGNKTNDRCHSQHYGKSERPSGSEKHRNHKSASAAIWPRSRLVRINHFEKAAARKLNKQGCCNRDKYQRQTDCPIGERAHKWPSLSRSLSGTGPKTWRCSQGRAFRVHSKPLVGCRTHHTRAHFGTTG